MGHGPGPTGKTVQTGVRLCRHGVCPQRPPLRAPGNTHSAQAQAKETWEAQTALGGVDDALAEGDDDRIDQHLLQLLVVTFPRGVVHHHPFVDPNLSNGKTHWGILLGDKEGQSIARTKNLCKLGGALCTRMPRKG